MLSLPIWIVTEHIQPTAADKVASEPGKALAFSSSDKIIEFLAASIGGEWKMQMAADRDGLITLIADLDRMGIEYLSLDPKKDGTDGKPISLTDLATYASSFGEQ